MGHVPKAVEWGGQKWYPKQGHYYNRRGELLHRAIYMAAFGEIPEGYHIHHKDGNGFNNDLSNLEAIPASEHVKKHPRGYCLWSTEQRRGISTASWQKREPKEVVCSWCGEAFLSTGVRATYCSQRCRVAYYRSIGKFTTPKKGRYVRPTKPCVICGTMFNANDPRTQCCSRACGYVYRRRRAEAAREGTGLQS